MLAGAAGVDSGSGQAVEELLAADVQTWFASPQQGLTGAIASIAGAKEAADAIGRLAPSTLSIVASVPAERACWAEVDRRAGGEDETCIVGLTYSERGQVSRLIWLRAPLVPSAELDSDPSAPAARPVIETYFADLIRSNFEAAAGHFSPDTIYSHPPYGGGTERVLFLGRDELGRGFVTERGPTPARQIITGFMQWRERFFVEGVVDGIPNGGTFFSTGQINPEGEIARYVAFYSAQRVPGRPS